MDRSHSIPSKGSHGGSIARADPVVPDAYRPFSAYPPALVEATLDRIVASTTFRRSQRHRQFLHHIVWAALAGRHEQLKEVIIGLEVFGRALATYDPRHDPIVRVEAGRVREKLARFYAAEGANEAFEIVIPVGGYMPLFARRKAAARSVRPIASLAVLPFTVLSNDPSDVSFSIGFADQLIDTLGRVPGLKVVGRVSAFKAGENRSDLKAIGKLLGVTHAVEGSIQRSGERMRCIAQLSRARDGVRIWSQRFERDKATDADSFHFQDTIADAVFAAVVAWSTRVDDEFSRAQLLRARPGLTDNAQARDLFERARYLAQQGTVDGYRKAIALFEKAVAIDPRFAQAYSHLGAALANLSPLVFEPARPSFAKVKRAALRALDLDPLDGDARALLAVVAYRIESNWTTAEPMFRDALHIAPNSTLAHLSYAWGLAFNGRFTEALQHGRMAREHDPLNLAIRAHNARLHSYAREYETAISELHLVLELDPHHLYSRLVLGIIHLSLGQHQVAMPHFERVAEEAPEHSSAHFHKICVYGMRGEIKRGKRELQALLERLGDSHYSLFNVALAQTCLGDREGAYASLEEAARTRDYLFVSIPAHELFDRYRDDPVFVDLLRRHELDLLPPWPEEQTARLLRSFA